MRSQDFLVRRPNWLLPFGLAMALSLVTAAVAWTPFTITNLRMDPPCPRPIAKAPSSSTSPARGPR